MINLLVCPESVSGRGVATAKTLVKKLKADKIEFAVYFSVDLEAVKSNVKEILALDEKDIVVIGNDEIVSLVINSVPDIAKINLGIIPVGSGDDFANYLGISSNPVSAIECVINKSIKNVDLMRVNGKYVLNNVIVGASVVGVEKFKQYKLKNAFTERLAMMKYATKFEGVDLVFDGKKDKKETIFDLIIANGGLCKNKPVSPLCNVQDGLLNITYSTVADTNGKAEFLKSVNRGEHVHLDGVKQSWVPSVKIASPSKDIKVMIDGTVDTVDTLDIALLDGALKLFL